MEVKPLACRSFTIKLKKHQLISASAGQHFQYPFKAGNRKWKLYVYPKGKFSNDGEDAGHSADAMSVQLHLDEDAQDVRVKMTLEVGGLPVNNSNGWEQDDSPREGSFGTSSFWGWRANDSLCGWSRVIYHDCFDADQNLEIIFSMVILFDEVIELPKEHLDESLFIPGKYEDVVLCIHSKESPNVSRHLKPVKRMALARRSHYFTTILFGREIGASSSSYRVTISDVENLDAFEAMIAYAVQGKLPEELWTSMDEALPWLMKMSDAYLMDCLKHICA